MMRDPMVERDERTVVVENASYRLAYLVVTYGLLVAVAYRALVLRQSSWDLLAIVVGAGLAAAGYQAFHTVLSRRSAVTAVVAVLAAVGAAVAVVILVR